MTPVLAAAAAHQHYLEQGRQMQALSFAAHIPLVCFGIALPALVLFLGRARVSSRPLIDPADCQCENRAPARSLAP